MVSQHEDFQGAYHLFLLVMDSGILRFFVPLGVYISLILSLGMVRSVFRHNSDGYLRCRRHYGPQSRLSAINPRVKQPVDESDKPIILHRQYGHVSTFGDRGNLQCFGRRALGRPLDNFCRLVERVLATLACHLHPAGSAEAKPRTMRPTIGP